LSGNLETTDTLCSGGKESELSPDDLRNNWLLAQSEEGEAAWNMHVIKINEHVLKYKVKLQSNSYYDIHLPRRQILRPKKLWRIFLGKN
jgi:hypothetical protein